MRKQVRAPRRNTSITKSTKSIPGAGGSSTTNTRGKDARCGLADVLSGSASYGSPVPMPPKIRLPGRSLVVAKIQRIVFGNSVLFCLRATRPRVETAAQTSASELQFRVDNSAGDQVGSASISVVGPAMTGVDVGRKAVGGVPTNARSAAK